MDKNKNKKNYRSKNHSFFIKDKIFYNLYFGNQTGKSIKKAGEEVMSIIEKLKKKNQKILILSDVSKIGDISLSARQAGLELIKEIEYDKLAICGADFVTAAIVKVIVSASGRSFKIRSFDSQKEALKWLKS